MVVVVVRWFLGTRLFVLALLIGHPLVRVANIASKFDAKDKSAGHCQLFADLPVDYAEFFGHFLATSWYVVHKLSVTLTTLQYKPQ